MAQQAECSTVQGMQAPKPRFLDPGFEWLHARSSFIFSAGFAVCDSFISCPWKFSPAENVDYASVPRSVIRLCLFVLRCESLRFLFKVQCKVTGLKMTVSASEMISVVKATYRQT